MISPSGAPRYSSTRLLTYSKLPSGPAFHTSAGIVSTTNRSSCAPLVRASSVLLPSLDIDRSMADLQIQTFVLPRRRVAAKDARRSVILPRGPTDGRRPWGLLRLNWPTLAESQSVTLRF